MQITDSQVHIWEAATPQRPWPVTGVAPHRTTPYTVEDLITDMDQAGVHRAILVPPSWQGDSNEYALEAARLAPDRFSVMGRIPALGGARPGALQGWLSQPAMRGVRLTLQTDNGVRALKNHELDWFWTAAQSNGVPIMVYAPHSLRPIAEIAERFPELKVILCHSGIPADVARHDVAMRFEQLAPLSALPNVAVKMPALPCLLEEPFPFFGFQQAIQRIVGMFGARRVFWSSDLTNLRCSYAELVSVYRDTKFLTDKEREWLLGRGISEWLGWPTATESEAASSGK